MENEPQRPPDTITCPQCGGNKTLRVDGQDVTCGVCQGDGEVPRS